MAVAREHFELARVERRRTKAPTLSEVPWQRTGFPSGKIVAIGNLKGGTGKSTLTINLAGAMVATGRRVCVVDCDPQGTSSTWLGKGHIGAFTECLPLDALANVGNWLERAKTLAETHEVVLIDLPAVVSPAMASAFIVAHLILVPVSLSSLDVHGTARVMRHIRVVREERPRAHPDVLLVPMRVPEAQIGREDIASIYESLRQRVGPPVRERSDFQSAFLERSWIGQTAPESAAHADISVLLATVDECLRNAADPPLLATSHASSVPSELNGHSATPLPSSAKNNIKNLPKKSWLSRFFRR